MKQKRQIENAYSRGRFIFYKVARKVKIMLGKNYNKLVRRNS